MTTEEYFKNLASKLEITEKERERISKKHNLLREKLREKLPVEDDFLTGSYSRDTMIRPGDDDKFDVDFFLAFNKDDYGNKELPELLKTVEEALDEIKAADEDIVAIDDQQKRSIGVIYNDNFQIDVVPAIQIEKDKLYKIFDQKTQNAVESNPKLHSKNLTDANESTEYGSIKRLVPIIKLFKAWRRGKCGYVKSFHLEMLIVKILKEQEIQSFSKGIIKFFANASVYLQSASLADPANENNIIDDYLDEDGTRDGVLSLVAVEKSIAEKAVEFENEGDNENAEKEWRKIFESEGDKNNGSEDPATKTGPVVINRAPAQPWCNV